jgi:succinate dehydrogenase / fumarate reductase membrane anchor subunit
MRYLTARKRVSGKGASHTGTEHHWSMTLSSVALACMIPLWIYIFGSALGEDRASVIATFSSPIPAILTALVLIVGMRHFAMGATMAIEDYSQGTTRKMLVIFVISLSTVIAASGLYALIRFAI